MLPDKRRGRLTPSRSRAIGTAIAVGAGIGMVVAAAVAGLALVRQQPASGVAFLLIPGIPVLAMGQLWAILTTRWRMPPRSRAGWARQPIMTWSWIPRSFFFGSLDGRAAAAFLAAAFCGWLLALTAFPALVGGGPAGHSATCAHVLSNHGSHACVSRSIYFRAGAGQQRFASGILLAFFSVHCGAALGSRRETTRSASDRQS